MRKFIAVIGEPGTGKTTLFREFMKPYVWERREEVKLVNTMYCQTEDLYIIGKYEPEEVFAGTDKLSMAVMPEAIKFVSNSKSNIMFEGDRLTGTKFFDFLVKLPDTELKIIVLKASGNMLSERYSIRGSNQSETFLKGRKTKIDNILMNFDYMDYIELFENNTYDDQKIIVQRLEGILKNET